MDTSVYYSQAAMCGVDQENVDKHLILWRRRRMGIEPTHRGLNPEHWI